MLVLKVMWQDQIRRIGFEPETTDGSFTALKAKLAEMLSLQDKSFVVRCGDLSSQTTVNSDETLNPLLEEAKKRNPPILRVVVEEGEEQPVEPEKLDNTPTSESVIEPEPVVESVAQPAEEVVQIEPQSDFTVRSCTSCNVILGSTYYKCLNCMSVELCESCEESQAHTAEHLFVKLRVPFSELSLRQQMIFKDYIYDQKERVVARDQKLKLREQLDKERNDKKAAQEKKRQQEKAQRESRLKKQRAEKKAEEARKKKAQAKKAAEAKKQEAARKKAAAVAKKEANKVVKAEVEKVHAPEEKPVEMVAEQVVPAPETEQPTKLKKRATKQLVTKKPKPFTIDIEANVALVQPTEESQMIADFHVIPSPPKDAEPTPSPEEEEMPLPLVAEEPKETVQQPEQVEEEPVVEAQSEVVSSEPQPEAEAQPEERKAPNAFVQNLERLAEMGFTDREKNVRLLVKHVGDLDATVEELLRGNKTFWFF